MKRSSDKFASISSKIKFVSGIISWVILVILVIVAMFLLYYFVAAKIYAQKGEDYKPAFALYTILSPSMVPNIKVYDVIVDTNVSRPEDIHEGDVITFKSTSSMTQGMIITHRVVQVKEENGKYSYVTKGDANLSPDAAPALFENVQGKVLFHIPQLGRVQEFLGTKGGWLLVVVLPALYIIISDIFKIARLKTVKEEVNSYENKVSEEKELELKKKQETEQKLMNRYGIEEKNEDKSSIEVEEGREIKEESEMPQVELELPVLKDEDEVNDYVELPMLKEDEEESLDTVDDLEEVEEEEEPEVVLVHGEALEKPKRKRKRKRKRKHHHSENQQN